MANFVRPLGFVLLGGIAGVGAAYWLAPEILSDPTVEAAGGERVDDPVRALAQLPLPRQVPQARLSSTR